MPIKMASYRGSSTPLLFKQGVYKAVDNGANIINFSSTGGSSSNYYTDAIQYARNNDCLIINCAGNENTSTRYPGYYSQNYDNLMAISGTDDNDDRYVLSNYGNWINVAAPAVDIFTTDRLGNYGYHYSNYIGPHKLYHELN